MLKEFFKSSALYGMAPFVPKILTVLLLPILTKYLTSVDFGIIGTITAIVSAIQVFQSLGIRSILANYFYKCRCQYKIVWREIYGFLSLWMIFYAIIQAVLLYFFIPKEAESNKWIIIILTNFSTVFFGPTAMIGEKYYQLNIKAKPVALRMILSGVITILTNFLCVVVFRWGYMGAYVGTFAGTFFVNMSYWPLVNRKLGLSPIYFFKYRTIKHILKVSIPIIPHFYTSYLMNSTNVVAMNVYGKSQAEIGHLSMAHNITTMIDSLTNAINQVFGPMTIRCIRDKDHKEMRRLLYTFILIVFSITFCYSLWSREAYNILISNEELAATYKYSIILVMALNYRPLYVYCGDHFIFFEKTVQLLGITFTAGLISCLLYFILMPFWGIYAALFGFYMGCLYYGYSGFFYRFYKKHTIYPIRWYLFFVLQIFLTIIAYFAVDLSIIYKLFLTLFYLIVASSIFYTRVIKVKNNRLLPI